LKTRLITLNVEVKEKDFQFENELKIYEEENQIETAKKIHSALIDCCVLYYGIHISQIQEVVLITAIQKIIKEFNSISIKEIFHAFERIEIQKQVTITIEDLLKPIRKYIYVKNYISKEFQNHLKEEQEKLQAVEKAIQHREECLNFYAEALSSGIWKGTIFHAVTIAKDFKISKLLHPEQVFEFWETSKREFKVIENDVENFLENFGKTAERLFAEKLIIEAIKQKIKLCK